MPSPTTPRSSCREICQTKTRSEPHYTQRGDWVASNRGKKKADSQEKSIERLTPAHVPDPEFYCHETPLQISEKISVFDVEKYSKIGVTGNQESGRVTVGTSKPWKGRIGTGGGKKQDIDMEI